MRSHSTIFVIIELMLLALTAAFGLWGIWSWLYSESENLGVGESRRVIDDNSFLSPSTVFPSLIMTGVVLGGMLHTFKGHRWAFRIQLASTVILSFVAV